MQIQLTSEGFKCLCDHVWPDSAAHKTLDGAVKVNGHGEGKARFAIECDLPTAEILLKIARVHCRPAVENLETGIERLRSGRNDGISEREKSRPNG
jgi:hypothetical protein